MAEREALERQIQRLQNLIKDHKRVHGNLPSSSSQALVPNKTWRRGQGPIPSNVPSYSHQLHPYAPHSSSQWKKKYSLNKTTRPPAGRPSKISEVNLQEVVHEGTSKVCSEPSSSVMGKESSLGSNEFPHDGGNSTVLKSRQSNSESFTNPGESASLRNAQQSGPDGEMRQAADISFSHQTALPRLKPFFTSASTSNQTVVTATKDSQTQTSSTATAEIRRQTDFASKIPVVLSPCKKSRFTWVKNQEPETKRTKSDNHQFSTSLVLASTASPVVSKNSQASGKKLHSKLGLPPSSPKTSKYSWVSSSCSPKAAAKSALAKAAHKLFSPKALKVPGKTAKEGPESKKLTNSASISKRDKDSGGTSTSHASHGSRYRWKAVAASSAASARGATLRSSRKSSAYRWTAQKDEKASASSVQPGAFIPLSNSEFKLRRRNLIIRRRTNSPASERRPSVDVVTIRSRYSLQRRSPIPVKTPSVVKRAHSRGLVFLGRHQLRRLSPSSSSTAPWSSKAGPSSPSVQNPPSHSRVIKTRYKIDTRRAQLQHHNPALSYRVKRVQSARFLLQSRLRASPDGQWRGRGMRWIGGELYSVSANKLSRTHTPNRSGSQEVPFGTRTSNSQHVASRAVQKSRAIIRQARQKKQQAKNYCMYYNRFGKCNRGSACPYIHDPDKVAVCTRFLRGTCKKTDGTCPFSHKVSKEKMPACSYFLKGICNNSSCPYSHVYVSRKAAVCQDFIRGYCPQGEKCKKKHTLVCPDFSRTGVCPQGTKCKLQHRQTVKRAGSSLSSSSSKKACCTDSTKSPRPEPEATSAEEDTPKNGPARLPSFILLSSSPEPSEGGESPSSTPGAVHAAGVEGTVGKKLHIKPRF